MILTPEERDGLLAMLSDEQRAFLDNELVRRRRTVFANEMVRSKGLYVPTDAEPEQLESLLAEWIYTGYIDAGKVTPDLRCECGRPLRYQHRVEHKTSGEIKHFGIQHLQEHLQIDSKLVSAILQGFDAIDYELDELLLKHKAGWQIDPDLLRGEVPAAIQRPLELGLPLLASQLRRLKLLRAVQPLRNYLAVAEQEQQAENLEYAERQSSKASTTSSAITPASSGDPIHGQEELDLFNWMDWQEQSEPEAIPADPQGSTIEPSIFELGTGAIAPAVDSQRASAYPTNIGGLTYSSKEGMLPAHLQAFVLDCLKKEMGSVRVICEQMLTDKLAPEARFLTGKPHIYVDVCLFLDKQPNISCELNTLEDRFYRMIEATSAYN